MCYMNKEEEQKKYSLFLQVKEWSDQNMLADVKFKLYKERHAQFSCWSLSQQSTNSKVQRKLDRMLLKDH